MAMSFTAQLERFKTRTVEKMEVVIKSSAQEVYSRANTPQPSVKDTGGTFEVGKVPVDIDDLWTSFVGSLNGGSYLEGPVAYELTIAGYELGDTIFGGWTAGHAKHIEYGTEDDDGNTLIEPRAYMRTAAAAWQDIVTDFANQVRNL